MRYLLSFALISLAAVNAQAQVLTQQNIIRGATPLDPDSIKLNELLLDRVIVRDDVYSSSRKTEIGDQTRIEMAFRYHTEKTTFVRMRFVTNPAENRFNNQTSTFEFIFSKRFQSLAFQLDLDLQTDDQRDGGSNLGPDIDSDDTFVSYNFNNSFMGTFYPFNFRTDVGDEFGTPSVTTINYIEGSPSSIAAAPAGSEKVITKTVPGLEVSWNHNGHQFYGGVGVATYLYPTNTSFNVNDNPNADSWERRQMNAYKLGYLFFDSTSRYSLQYIDQDNSEETGTLIENAASALFFKKINNTFLIELEATMTRAGKNPYRLNRSTNWFNDLTPFEPIFSDYFGEPQDWINKVGHGLSMKLGYQLTDKVVPYLLVKQQSEHFLFNGEESAHRLRTDDETKSHGGLLRYGAGTYFYYDKFFFRPEMEWRNAKNAVFSKSTDVRDDRILSSFKKNDLLFTINVTYTFDGSSGIQNWWF